MFADAPRSDGLPLDILTSESPTFPHTDEECEGFIETLERSKGVFSPSIPCVGFSQLVPGRSCFQPSNHYLRR